MDRATGDLGILRDAKQIVSVLPVTDLERSRKFYRDTLGLSEIRRDLPDGGVDYGHSGGAQLHIFPKPGITSSGNTMAMFLLDDLDATVKDLKRRGVTFERFNMPGMTWEGDIGVIGNDKRLVQRPRRPLASIGTEPI